MKLVADGASSASAGANSISTEQLERAIAQIDVYLKRDSPAASLFVDRGQFLEMLGRKDEALQAYVDALHSEPTNVEALNALGLLFMAAGNHAAARTVLSGAVLHGPRHAAAHANLAYVYVLGDHLTGARALYERALLLDPELAIAHHGLAELLPRLGDAVGAAHHRSLGLRCRPITIGRYTGEGRPVRVLALGTAAVGNVPTYGYFDTSVFLLASLTVDYADPAVPLPPHDIVFNAIGEADLCANQLALAAVLSGRTNAPIINHPHAVAATSRAENSRRLRRLEGVATPQIISIARTALIGSAVQARLSDNGLCFPLLVRSPGYHTGDHFVKVDRAEDLDEAITELPGDDLLVIEFLDTCDAAGDFRKYRTIIVNGKLYPLHLAVSRAWKVHYFSAQMADSAEHRAEDAAFLTDMRAVLGARAFGALERIRDMLALDYGGIDFALSPAGDIIVFEANASMIVPSPEPGAMWEYRREPVARIRTAVRDMLVGRAAAYVSVAAHEARPQVSQHVLPRCG